MKYRRMGRTGPKVSVLGFGCMRFPTLSGRPSYYGRVDEEETQRMLHAALEKGVDYFDTAYNYHGGRSEAILGRFLKTVDRARVLVATKLPGWCVKKPSDFRRIFRTQLRRLQTETVDFYLLHAMGGASFERLRQMGVLEFIAGLKRDGLVRFLGFSFHDRGSSFRPIVDAFDWDMCQIQYNIIDEKNQAGRAGLRYASEKGLGVVAMEPLRGGDLVTCMPDSIRGIWEGAGPGQTPSALCLSWLWNQPEVSVVLSGMSAMEQLGQNAGLACRAMPGMLSTSDKRLISKVKSAYSKLPVIPCTRCGYCMPCPSGVDIPRNFSAYNEGILFPGSGMVDLEYRVWMKPEQRAPACTACGRCEEKCPQKLPVRKLMREVAANLERKRK
jgi:predicted aldo/keto reductase-like oxidoreductase